MKLFELQSTNACNLNEHFWKSYCRLVNCKYLENIAVFVGKLIRWLTWKSTKKLTWPSVSHPRTKLYNGLTTNSPTTSFVSLVMSHWIPAVLADCLGAHLAIKKIHIHSWRVSSQFFHWLASNASSENALVLLQIERI